MKEKINYCLMPQVTENLKVHDLVVVKCAKVPPSCNSQGSFSYSSLDD